MDQKNLILAIVMSVAILLGWQLLFPEPPKKPPQTTEQQATPAAPQPSQGATGPAAPPTPGAAPGAPGAPTVAGTGAQPGMTREAALAASPRLKISSPRVDASIALKGGRLDDLALAQYRVTVDPKSPEIVLLSPQGVANPYFADFGWTATGADVKLPGADAVWRADRVTVSPGQPATLTWENGEGLTFTRIIALDDNFMFTVTQRVKNAGTRAVTLYPYTLISRTGTPDSQGTYVHEGGVGWLGGGLREHGYGSMKDKGTYQENTKGGWLGITDKYWLVALVPDVNEEVTTHFTYALRDRADVYQVDYLGTARALAPGGEIEASGRLFAGAKEIRLLNDYEEYAGVDHFPYAIDWGYIGVLTKPLSAPIFYLLEFFKTHVFQDAYAGFGLAILLLTVLIKIAFFPLANKSYRSMSKMKILQPKMMELRERFKDDKARLNQEMMALYKAEGANPMSGCLPLLVQIPVFIALYQVLYVTIEMRHAPFYGWVHDLSAPDPLSLLHLFGLIPMSAYSLPEFLVIGIWPLIMGATMFIQQRLNPAPADPAQQKMFMLLPLIFTFMLARVPVGLVIYWAWNNVLSVAQQWYIMRKAGASPSRPAAPKAAKKKT